MKFKVTLVNGAYYSKPVVVEANDELEALVKASIVNDAAEIIEEGSEEFNNKLDEVEQGLDDSWVFLDRSEEGESNVLLNIANARIERV